MWNLSSIVQLLLDARAFKVCMLVGCRGQTPLLSLPLCLSCYGGSVSVSGDKLHISISSPVAATGAASFCRQEVDLVCAVFFVSCASHAI